MATSITNTSVTTDNLTVDTNTIHVDSTNNRVGIGTTSPADHLSVVTTGANAQLSVDRSDGGAGRTVLIHSSTGGQLQTTGSVPLIFGTADIERMRIDTNGYVTTPNLPSFLTYGSPSTTSVGSNHYYFHSFSNSGESYNNGSHYNNTTGKFTAPVAGRYAFGFSIWRGQAYSGGDQLISINKNTYSSGGAYVGSNASGSQYDQIQVHMTYNMAANDWVAPGLYYTGSFSVQASTPRNYFYGYLIG